MQNSFEMFLLAVEEMSFSKAAKRANVTQQCLSAHILKLEERYGIRFFTRRPRLRLTLAGETMVQAVRQIQIIENNLDSTLEEIRGESQGHLVLGINPTRAQLLLPGFLSAYHESHPHVTVSFLTEDTKSCEQLLLNGKIDLFLGIDTSSHPLFRVMPLVRERVFLIVADSLLSRYCGGDLEGWKAQMAEEGANLREFGAVPFIRNLEGSTLNLLMDRHTDGLGLRLNTRYAISAYSSQIEVCGAGLAAAFCPAMLLHCVHQYNRVHPESQGINIFPVRNLEERLRIDLVSHKNVRQPLYIRKFTELMTLEYRKWCAAE